MYTDSVSSLDEIHVAAFLEDYHKKELHFLTENVSAPEDILARRAPDVPGISAPDAAHGAPGSTFSISALTLPEYLARRAFFFAARKTAAPKDIFARYKRAGGFLTLSKDSILNRFAYNMTSASYLTDPAIGREAELKDLELILISPKKSPILLGEAGVGKTAVVEGLAWRLQQGMVPSLLQNKEIYKLTTTSLLSGTKYVGEMEERIRQLMEELDRHPDILLFIDEIHTIVGAGSTESSNNDISNMLKPYIDRGDIKIIGSTTSAEYNQYLLSDKALARRFYPITVEEPDEETTMQILLGTLPATEHETRVRHTFSDKELRQILGVLIHLSHEEYQPTDRRTAVRNCRSRFSRWHSPSRPCNPGKRLPPKTLSAPSAIPIFCGPTSDRERKSFSKRQLKLVQQKNCGRLIRPQLFLYCNPLSQHRLQDRCLALFTSAPQPDKWIRYYYRSCAPRCTVC